MKTFSQTWVDSLIDIMSNGDTVKPRGQGTKEIQQRTITVDMRKPVLMVPDRKLNYKFMAAEAYWILSGDDKAENIVPYNKHIGNFSDDGITFFGAYGPKISAQLDYVVAKLKQDNDTRQAGLTIWRENPKHTKDVPCTVAMFFNIRNGKLNANVFMRSSDIWLGIPYDVFNFSMVAHLICCRINDGNSTTITPGNLYLTAASSHLYDVNADAARGCTIAQISDCQPTPGWLYQDEDKLMSTIKLLRDSSPGDTLRWWE